MPNAAELKRTHFSILTEPTELLFQDPLLLRPKTQEVSRELGPDSFVVTSKDFKRIKHLHPFGLLLAHPIVYPQNSFCHCVVPKGTVRAEFPGKNATRSAHPMNEQMYSAIPLGTLISNPDFAGTSKDCPAV